jgi:hypothetical protein
MEFRIGDAEGEGDGIVSCKWPGKEALNCSETSVLTRATRRNIPEDTILHRHRRENLKSHITVIVVLTGMNTCPSGKSTLRSYAPERKPQAGDSILDNRRGRYRQLVQLRHTAHHSHGGAPRPGLHDPPPAEAQFGASTRYE